MKTKRFRRSYGAAAALIPLALIAACSMVRFGTQANPRHALAALDTPVQGVFELSDPSSFRQVIAVSDVHGMYDALVPMLRAANVIDAHQRWSAGATLLVVVGDSIDKGPKSIEVLDLWMALASEAKAAGGQVVHLLGNHEAEFLADPGNGKAAELLAELQQRQIPLTDLTDPTQPRGSFLRHMPVAARVGRWLFCHAGLYPELSWASFSSQAESVLSQGNYGVPFLSDPNSILEAKNWWQDPTARTQLLSRLGSDGMFGLVQGHQPKAYYIPNTIGSIEGGRMIKIDNGMAPEAGSHPGHLLLFPNPSEMTSPALPHVEVVAMDGTMQPLVPSP